MRSVTLTLVTLIFAMSMETCTKSTSTYYRLVNWHSAAAGSMAQRKNFLHKVLTNASGVDRSLHRALMSLLLLHSCAFLSVTSIVVPVGRRGSLVACATCKRELAGSSRRLGLTVLWRCAPGKAHYPHVHSLDPGVNGQLVGQQRFVCLNSFCVSKMAAVLCAPWGV